MTPPCLVFAGGDRPTGPELDAAIAWLGPPGRVVAADSGADHALAAHMEVDLVVGDLDSIGAEARAVVAERGTTVQQHPVDKDYSDLELALAACPEGSDVAVVGIAGGRLDHELFNLVVLADERWGDRRLRGYGRSAEIAVVRDAEVSMTAPVGTVLSLLAVGAPATVSVAGVRYPLSRSVLRPTSARGLSNVIVGSEASVTAHSGTILAMRQLP